MSQKTEKNNNKRLYTLLYGEDGTSGFIGTLHMEGVFDKEMADEAKTRIKEIACQGKQTKTVSVDDVAALSDMFIDLVANMDVGKEVEDFLNEAIVMVQELYEE